MRDSYESFFANGYISKQAFFEFGLKETIYAPYEKAEKEWESLKLRIISNQSAYIRGFGRDAAGTHLFLSLYEKIFNNTNIRKDPSNNSAPAKLIRDLTGYSKTPNPKFESIRNYQISHVFGRTKNVFAFTAPWNIVYMPKLLDPFTGHEAKGQMVAEFTTLFRKQSYARFSRLIDDFNEVISNPQFLDTLGERLDELKSQTSSHDDSFSKFEKAVEREFRPIVISS